MAILPKTIEPESVVNTLGKEACVHYWRLGNEAVNGWVKAICLRCGAEKEFTNSSGRRTAMMSEKQATTVDRAAPVDEKKPRGWIFGNLGELKRRRAENEARKDEIIAVAARHRMLSRAARELGLSASTLKQLLIKWEKASAKEVDSTSKGTPTLSIREAGKPSAKASQRVHVQYKKGKVDKIPVYLAGAVLQPVIHALNRYETVAEVKAFLRGLLVGADLKCSDEEREYLKNLLSEEE